MRVRSGVVGRGGGGGACMGAALRTKGAAAGCMHGRTAGRAHSTWVCGAQAGVVVADHAQQLR